MPGFGQIVRELAAEISILANTKAGADKAAGDFKEVGDAAEKTSEVVEENVKVSKSAERAYDRLEKFIDPLATAQKRLAKDEQTLRRAREQGIISADKYEEQLKRLNSQFERNKRRIAQNERAQEGLNRETREYADVAQRLGPLLAGAFAGLSIGRISSEVREATADLDNLAKRARDLGGIQQADFLQSGAFALGQLGIDDGERFIKEFNRRTAQALAGRGEGVGLLKELEGGEALLNQVRQAESLETQFLLVVDALNKIDDAQKRVLVGNAFFGEELGTQIGALSEAGAEGVRKLQAEARAAGLVIEDGILITAEEMNDRFEKSSQIVDVQLKRAFITLAPAIAATAEASANLLKGLADGLEEIALQRRILEGRQPISVEIDLTNGVVVRDRLTDIAAQIDILEKKIKASTDEQVGRFATISGLPFDPSDLSLYEEQLKALQSEQIELVKIMTSQASPAVAEWNVTTQDMVAALARGRQETEGISKASAAAAKSLAAARAAFDPLGDVNAQIERADALRLAALEGPDALQTARDRFVIEDKIARARIEAARLGLEFDEDALRAALARLNAIKQETDEIIKDQRGDRPSGGLFGDAVRELESGPLLRAVTAFWRGFGAQGADVIRDLGDEYRGAFGGGGVFTPGINGGSPANAGGGLLNGAALVGVDLAQFYAQQAIANTGLFQPAPGFAKANFLNLASESIASVVPGGQTALQFGRLGVAAANAIDGNGANRTTAAVGQNFGFLGGLLAGLFSKASRNGAVVQLGVGGEVIGTDAKDKGRGDENLSALLQFTDELQGAISTLEEITGGVAGSLDRAISLDDIDGFYTLGAGGRRDFGDDGAAAFDSLLDVAVTRLRGGDAELRGAVQAIARATDDAEDLLDRAQNLEVVFDDPFVIEDPLAARLDGLDDAFGGLEDSSRDVAASMRRAAAAIADTVDEEARRGLLEDENPQRAAIEEVLRRIDARNAELDRLVASGGVFDASLVSEFQRRQILAPFNLEERFRQASDPAAAAIEALQIDQANERDALRIAIERSDGLITEADFNSLIRTQEAERFRAFQGLSDEDRARLAGRGDDFDDLAKRYAIAVERFLEESTRLVDGFDSERRRLQGVVADRLSEERDLASAVKREELRLGGSAPGESVALLRTQVEDLRLRAVSDDEEDAAFARANLEAAVSQLNERAEQVYGGASSTTQSIALFGLDALRQARDAAALDRTTAEQQLSVLEQTRDLTQRLVDLSAAPQLDIAAVLDVVGRLDPAAPIADLARDLAALEAARTDQTARFNALLETLGPQDVGLGGPGDPSPSTDPSTFLGGGDVGPTPRVVFSDSAPPPADDLQSLLTTTSITPPSPTQAPANDDAAAELLLDISERLADIETLMKDDAQAERASEKRRERHLNRIANSR